MVRRHFEEDSTTRQDPDDSTVLDLAEVFTERNTECLCSDLCPQEIIGVSKGRWYLENDCALCGCPLYRNSIRE
jgi:hypothetical protein